MKANPATVNNMPAIVRQEGFSSLKTKFKTATWIGIVAIRIPPTGVEVSSIPIGNKTWNNPNPNNPSNESLTTSLRVKAVRPGMKKAKNSMNGRLKASRNPLNCNGVMYSNPIFIETLLNPQLMVTSNNTACTHASPLLCESIWSSPFTDT